MEVDKIKYKFLFLFIGILLLTNVLASECSQSGYDNCYENSYNQGSATATAKCFWNDINTIGGIYVIKDNAKVKVGYSGDKLYYLSNGQNYPTCNENGCNSQQINSGDFVLGEKGEEINSCFSFYSWDYDFYSDSGGEDWAWTITHYSYYTPCKSLKVIECYDDSNCDNNYFCDKSGEWTNWNCKYRECQEGESKCEGLDYYTCQNNNWNNNGLVLNKCNIECITDYNCQSDSYVGEKYCSNNNVVQNFKDYSCSNYKCDLLMKKKF